MATIPDALALAVQHHQAGRLQAAEQIYRQVLAADPNQPEALHLLGVIAHQMGGHEAAIPLIEGAIRLHGTSAAYHSNLGESYRALRRIPEAISCFRRALELKPDFALAHNNLGLALHDDWQLDAAARSFHEALRLDPDFAEAHNNLGITLTDQGRLAEAIGCYERALQLKPDFVGAHVGLADALKQQGRVAEASACYRRALELEPGLAPAHNKLGHALHEQGQLDAAADCYRQALQLKPDFAEALNNLGITLTYQGRLAEAVNCYERALELKPDFTLSRVSLGSAFKDQGRLHEAIASYRRTLELDPDYAPAHSNLVYTLLFCPDYDAATIFEEHRRWNHHHAAPLARFIQPHDNDRSPDRRLRIGYVSQDFRNHVVGRNLLPLLREHDHQHFEVTCYANMPCPDEFTPRFQKLADTWRNVVGLTDEQLAQLVRQDRIDILVDLTLHMARNRLLVFARKPAPVQVTFAGYPGTTGLTAIDYRLTDPYLDPPGLDDQYYSEESIRLPDTFWCYDPVTVEPAVNPLPALANGFLTFGCFNNFCKVNAQTLMLWAKVLRATGSSRLMLLAPEGEPRRNVLDLMEKEGIAANRVDFVSKQPRPGYLELYHRIDLGLDTLPYNGHTTSLDSTWMGVPVVTLIGRTVGGRAGVSLLNNLHLRELIAHAPEEFVGIVVTLAADLPRLSMLRGTLRGRMQASTLMDAPRFARAVEGAFRSMWQRWCAGARST